MISLEDNKYYIREDDLEGRLLLHIVQVDEDESMSYMKLYCFGGENLLGEEHEFDTPNLMLADYLLKNVTVGTLIDISKDVLFPKYEYSLESREYVIKIEKDKENLLVSAHSIREMVEKTIPILPCHVLSKLIAKYTMYEAVPVYCDVANPRDLYVYDALSENVQIGYVIVDTEEMREVTLYKYASQAVEELVYMFTDLADGAFMYELYFDAGFSDKEDWSLIESSDIYYGTDIYENGMLDDLGEEWLDAEEYEKK